MLIMLTIIATSLTIACICIYSIQQNEDYLLMVDVGQGDAFIVRSNHITALIDTGNNGYKLRNACSRLGIRHFDYVVITHRDDDHCGALGYISQFIDIDCIVLAQQISFESNDACRQLNILSNEIAKGVMYVFPGDSIQVGDITLHVLWPYSFKDAGGNEDSICLYGEFDDLSDKTIEASMLFTGDLESQELKSIVEKSSISDIDILKVGHHGSANSLDSEILSVLEPRIALIGVGNGNRYGHPDSETIALLDRADAHVFRSDEYGCVKCSLSSQGIEVRSVIQ